jgi:hypothetical protein
MHIPGELVVLAEQIHLMLESEENAKWWTYFDFYDSGAISISSEWDSNSRAIFELQELPPIDETRRHIDWYRSLCNDSEELSDSEISAFKIMLTRSADTGLIPLYGQLKICENTQFCMSLRISEFMNHHNRKINTYLKKDDSGGLKVMTLKKLMQMNKSTSHT